MQSLLHPALPESGRQALIMFQLGNGGHHLCCDILVRFRHLPLIQLLGQGQGLLPIGLTLGALLQMLGGQAKLPGLL